MVDRFGWRYFGQSRPSFADVPGSGEESVWDYPRPPRIVADARVVTVSLAGVCISKSSRAVRVLETASPPTFYLPPDDIEMDWLRPAGGGSRCEWKGAAEYYSVEVEGRTLERCAWGYPRPLPAFREIAGYLSFYPAMLECEVAGERVRPQPGGFYGGWLTSEIVGPVKGEAGTGSW